ncbi:hypothetical protein V2W45_1511865 [Cenococcum geophilum]
MVYFGKRKSDGWHKQIDVTAATERPTSGNFPWDQLRAHTDLYLKKKGKLTSAERDHRLSVLIHSHDTKDIAIAACAHAMSPQAIRAALNVALNVAPGTYYGLYSYLQAFVAANHCNPTAITELEAKWARALMPYSTPGVAAPSRCLEGVVRILTARQLTSLEMVPDFHALARRACKDFAAQLEGLKVKSQWIAAYAAASWLPNLLGTTASPRIEGLLDAEFLSWRVWAAWRPNLNRLRLLEGLPGERRAVLPDILSLEGPDFLQSRQATLREGLIARNSNTPISTVRVRGLAIEVKTGTASELQQMLDLLLDALENACRAGNESVALFVHFCIGKTVNQEALQIMEGNNRIADPSVTAAVLQLHAARGALGSMHADAMMRLFPALGDTRGELLREVLGPYLLNGVQNCVQEMQDTLHKQLNASGPWTDIQLKLQKFGKALQETPWLQPLLDAPLRALLYSWPSLETIKLLKSIRTAVQNTTSGAASASSLNSIIDMYCMDRLIKRGTIEVPSARLIDALIYLWRQASDPDRRALALFVARGGINSDLRCRCLRQLPLLADDFVRNFRKIMEGYTKEGDASCVELTRILATTAFIDAVDCWRPVLYRMIEQRTETLIDYTLSNLTAQAWLQWLWDLSTIFGDLMPSSLPSSPAVLQPGLQIWSQQLAEYVPTITRLEALLGSGPALQCILLGGEGPWIEDLIQILDLLTEHHNRPYERIMQVIAGLLSRDGSDAKEVCEALSLITATTPEGTDACKRCLEIYQKTSKIVSEALVIGWIQASGMTERDRTALKAVAGVLDLQIEEDGDLPMAKLEAAADHLDFRARDILAEARRLESLRMALKSKDPKGTSALMASLGIQDSYSPLDEELDSLPPELSDLIEKYSEEEVEMSFPLRHLTGLQRTAMGTGTAQTVLMRLVISDYTSQGEMPPAFCIHLDNEPNAPSGGEEHYYWPVFKDSGEPDVPHCHGRGSRITWQLSRIVSRHLRKGFTSLNDVHKFVTARINDLAHSCLVCGAKHGSRGASLQRPTVCHNAACSKIWNRVALDVRLTEIRTDPGVVDLLLTGIFAAAQANRLDLLPGCPIRSTPTIVQALNNLPAISVLQTMDDISVALENAGPTAAQLVNWACSSYRGFLASTSGILHIPGLPGARQFVLTNAAPEQEAAFTSKVGRQNTSVLFHGTSIDRLPAILCQGLRICSGTSLQRTGAAHGNGIYTATEPLTSFSYSPAIASWPASTFHNMRLLLGCELVGNGNPVTGGIHVIKDPGVLMVRYIFLFPMTAAAPQAMHITPAMVSAFAGLRSGAL